LANLIPKVPAESWLDAARRALVDEGIDAVKVDRLAKGLGVSRGGFYHHFVDRDDLLLRLIETWRANVVFVPDEPEPANPRAALRAIEALVDHLLREDGYDPRFDLAVRSWAHADARAASAVRVADAQRIATLTGIFRGLGCEDGEAAVRSRVFYFHQIGYYLIDMHEESSARRERVATYIEILCGEHHLAAARAWKPSMVA
jgi:AcrR family transcriptional regulator